MDINIANRFSNCQLPFSSLFAFCLLFLVFICGCLDNPSDTENLVTFSGTVTLEGKTDHSGVKISLYEPAKIDEELHIIQDQYPTIGIQISQQTEFDHRDHIAKYTTVSNTDGSWKIEGVNKDKYNVVAEKDEYGWKYVYDVENSNIDIILKTKYVLSGVISENLELPENLFVEINNDVTIAKSVLLRFAEGTWILFKNGARMRVYGSIQFAKGQHKYTTLTTENSSSSKIIIDNMDKSEINNIIVHRFDNALYFTGCDTVKIRDCRISNVKYGIAAFNCGYVSMSNNLVSNTEKGVSLNNSNGQISNNIFINATIAGIEVISSSYVFVFKNVLNNVTGNSIDVNPAPGYEYNDTYVNIYNCDFSGNNKNVYVGTNSIVKNNSSNYYDCIYFNVDAHDRIKVDTLDFRMNYWGTVFEVEIASKIHDKLDRPGMEGPVVDFSAYFFEKIAWDK